MAKQIVLPFFTLINGQSIAFDKQIIWNIKVFIQQNLIVKFKSSLIVVPDTEQFELYCKETFKLHFIKNFGKM